MSSEEKEAKNETVKNETTNISKKINKKIKTHTTIKKEKHYKKENLSELKTLQKFKLKNEGKTTIELFVNTTDEKAKNIKIKLKQKNLDEEEITVSSEKHVEDELLIFRKLKNPVEEKNIKIFWKNENKFVKKINYFDDDNDGLIEKISWVIPHLSEQIFKILLERKNSTTSTEIEITNLKDMQEIQTNPINFSFNVSYNKNLTCKLKINNSEKETNENITLPNGNYTWKYYCESVEDSNINKTIKGNFIINETFEITGLKKIYFLDWNGNLINSSEKIKIINKNYEKVNINISVEGKQDKSLPKSKEFLIGDILYQNTLKTYSMKTSFKGLEKEIKKENSFEVVKIKVEMPPEVKEEENTNFKIHLNSSSKINKIILFFGDGKNKTENIGLKTKELTFVHKYSTEETYTPKIRIYLNNSYEELEQDRIKVVSSEKKDTTDPIVTITSPTWKLYKNFNLTKTIDLTFKVNENVKLKKCSIKISNGTLLTKTSLKNKVLENETTLNNSQLIKLEKGEIITIPYEGFEEKAYLFELDCEDNSSNNGWDSVIFEVSYSDKSNYLNNKNTGLLSYEREEEVEELITKANEFIDKEESWKADEKKALEDLGFIEKVKTYKRQLIDIDKFFKANIKYVASETLKEARIKENNDLLDKIKENLPTDIKIISKYDYIKNRNSFDWKELIKDYYTGTNQKLTKSIKKLKTLNEELQNSFSVSNTITNLEINYLDRTENLILVNKKIKSKLKEGNKILEILPNKLSSKYEEINFLTDSKEIQKKNIYELNLNKMESNEIKYTLKNKNLVVKDLENTDTIIFNDKIKSSSFSSFISGLSLTGLLGANENSEVVFVGIVPLIITIFFFVLFLIYRFIKKLKIKKDPNVYKIFELIKEIRMHLRTEEILDARKKYYQIKELYLILNENSKKEVLPLSKRALKAIDKKDIFNLTKEYKKAKNNFQKEEALELQTQISKIYLRLHKKKDKIKVKKAITDF